MRFFVDAQLPPALARWLEDGGQEAWHVADLGLLAAADVAIWDECCSRGAVLLTKDEDFIGIRSQAREGPAIVWLRIGNAANPYLLEWFGRKLPLIIAALEAGETVVEVR